MENSKQPAFAVSKEMAEASNIEGYPFGLTKREYFAGQILQSFATNINHYGGAKIAEKVEGVEVTYDQRQNITMLHYVNLSIKIADELLKQLDKTP